MSNESAVTPVQTEDLVIGFLYTFISLLEAFFYVPCLLVIRRDQELKSLSCFRMMFHLGIADMCVLFVQGVGGILIMTRWAYNLPYWLNKLYGAFGICFGWCWYMALLQTIAVNRCVSMCMPAYYKMKLFSDRATTFWLVACFAFAATWFVVCLMPKCSFILVPEVFTFYFDISLEWSEQVQIAMWYAEILVLNTCLVWYAIILVYMRKQSNMMLTGSDVQIENRVKERKILYQAALICIYTLVWSQYWHLAPYLYDKYNFVYAYSVGNLFAISNCGINPLVYMTLNKTIQQKVKGMILRNGATVSPSAVVVGGTRRGQSSTRGGQCSTHGGQNSTRGGQCSTRGGQNSTRGGQCSTRGGQCSTRGGQCSTRGGQCSTRGGQSSKCGGQRSTRGGQSSTRGGKSSNQVHRKETCL